MKTNALAIALPGAVALVGVIALVGWSRIASVGPLEARLPGMDGYTVDPDSDIRVIPEPGEPIRGEGVASNVPGAWPWFRGPNRDAICDDGTSLVRPSDPWQPTELWQVTMGQGYASPVVADGCVYVLDYDEDAKADTMRCLSLDDGGEIWRNSYPVVVPWNHGMSRTVAAIAGEYVISFGPKCHVACWRRDSGECVWLIDLVLDHGATVPQWYAGQCPLVDDDRVILAPGGDALLMAVDYATGDIVWESPNPRGWDMTHSSVVRMDFAGRRTYVYCGDGGVAGVDAEDGAILWDTTQWRISMATCPSPVPVGQGRIFLSGGYNAGAMMLELGERDGEMVAEELFRLNAKQFGSEQQTPVLFDGHLYGIRQRDKQLVCMALDGNEVWNSGRDKFGSSPYMIADGLLLVMNDHGVLTVAEATAEAYRPLARAEVIENGHDAWGPMALVAGRLIVRDMTRMVCLDIAK